MRTMKRKIAALLVGTMLATQPASLPVWAAPTSEPSGSTIRFDFKTLNPAIEKIVDNVDITDTTTGASNELMVKTGSTAPSDFHGMQIDTTHKFVYLPFIKQDGADLNIGKFDKENLYEDQHNPAKVLRKLNNKTWTEMGLEGYEITSWMSDKEAGFPLWRMDSIYYPTRGMTYYAKLGPEVVDPTKTDKKKYRNYKLHLINKSPAGKYVPGLETDQNKLNQDHPVMDSIPQSPIIPDGFKITNSYDVNDTVKFYDPKTEAEFTGFDAKKAGFAIDSGFNIKGYMVNKTTKITYNYDVDTTVKKDLEIVDEIYKSAACTDPEPIVLRRPIGSYPAYEDIGAKKIKANKELLKTSSGMARYILKDVKIEYIDSDKNIREGNLDANKTLLIDDYPNSTSTVKEYTKIKEDVTTPGKIIGQMPNQDVKITYRYYVNNSYETTLKVRYQDDMGNDITDSVVKYLEKFKNGNNEYPTSSAGLINGGIYKEENNNKAFSLNIKTGVSSSEYDINIPVPKLPDYKYSVEPDKTDNPKARVDGDTADWGNSYQTAIENIDSSWTSSHTYFDLKTVSTGPIETKSIIVTYKVDPTANVQVIFGNEKGGSVKVSNNVNDRDYNVNTDIPVKLARVKKEDGSNTYNLNITSDNIIYYPVANPGYKFEHWDAYVGDIKQKINFNTGSTQTIANIPNSENTVSMIAIFKKEPDKFNNYYLQIGGNITSLPAGNHAEIANVDTSGNRIPLTFNNLSEYTNVTAKSGYIVKWYKMVDGKFIEIQGTESIDNLNGQTFYAFAEQTNALVVVEPVATGQLHPGNGEPSIQIAPNNIDLRLDYIIVDPPTGNVISKIRGLNLSSTGGEITNSLFTPGQSYEVYTALPNAGVTVGETLPLTGVSTHILATIPTAINPQPNIDSNNRGKVQITIAPVTVNTDYALIGPNGVARLFKTPSGNDLVFDNLDPDVNYEIVARPTGTTTDPVRRRYSTSPTSVSTSNLVIVKPNNNVTIISDSIPLYGDLTLDANSPTTPNPLDDIPTGTQVSIRATSVDNAGRVFQSWNVVRGLRNYNIVGDRITFTMPNVPVTLQTVFSPISASNTWSKDYIDNINSNQGVGVIYPVVNEAGDFRIQIIKSSIPTATRNAIAFETDDSFKSVFLMTFNVQKKDPVTGNWENYVDPTGANITFDANIETGALLGNRRYGFYELGGSLASPSNAAGNTINPFTGVDFTSPSYTGEFSITVSNGSTYAWGYTLPDDVRKVIVKDARYGTIVSTFNIDPTRVIEDYASLYTANIINEYVDDNGITWHYEGVSDDRDSFVPTDTTTRVLFDTTVYLYFSNDRPERAQAASDLDDLIKQANIELPRVANTGMLQMAIDAARAVLTKTNRKSSTAELKAAFDALELALRNAGRKSSGGGSSSGGGRGSSGRGSSGGGGAASNAGRTRANTWSGSTPIAVGVGGNWELINPEEAAKNLDNSKWIFKLTTGERVTGWQLLSYTFEDRTKVEWYHFEQDGIMDSGWFLDRDTNKWYYLSMNHDGFFGEMIKGWHNDPDDTRWYFLDRNDGHMHVSWDKIDGNWYFFNPNPPAQTWFFDNTTGRWNYGDNKDIRPLGSMYVNEETPDGFHVNADGAWR